MNNLFYNAVIKFANGTNNYTDDPEQAKEDMRIVISRIADYLVWGFLAIGVIMCIFIGFIFGLS